MVGKKGVKQEVQMGSVDTTRTEMLNQDGELIRNIWIREIVKIEMIALANSWMEREDREKE